MHSPPWDKEPQLLTAAVQFSPWLPTLKGLELLQLMQPLQFLLGEVLLDIKGKVEDRPLPKNAIDLQFTPHLAKDLVADCQAESDAMRVDLFIVVAYLAKHAEQFGPVFLLYTNAIVFHRDHHARDKSKLLFISRMEQGAIQRVLRVFRVLEVALAGLKADEPVVLGAGGLGKLIS